MPQIRYDLQKNLSNLEKHGIALAQAHHQFEKSESTRKVEV
jgi:uncharacterized DUF497 family protein